MYFRERVSKSICRDNMTMIKSWERWKHEPLLFTRKSWEYLHLFWEWFFLLWNFFPNLKPSTIRIHLDFFWIIFCWGNRIEWTGQKKAAIMRISAENSRYGVLPYAYHTVIIYCECVNIFIIAVFFSLVHSLRKSTLRNRFPFSGFSECTHWVPLNFVKLNRSSNKDYVFCPLERHIIDFRSKCKSSGELYTKCGKDIVLSNKSVGWGYIKPR